MTSFEEKLKKRQDEAAYQSQLSIEAMKEFRKIFEESGFDIDAAAKSLLGTDKNDSIIIRNYNKTMADELMTQFELFQQHCEEMERRYGKGNIFGDATFDDVR